MNNVTTPFATQPAVKLASANMGLLLRFAASPEVMSQATQVTTQMLQQGGSLALKTLQTGAYLQLVQGLMQNYTEFLAESGRAAATWMQRVPEALEAAPSRAQRAGRAG